MPNPVTAAHWGWHGLDRCATIRYRTTCVPGLMAELITVSSRLRPEDAAEVISALRAVPKGEPATLDLSSLSDIASRSGLDLTGISLLANVLLTAERRRPLTVRVPSGDAALRQLARGGLWFALAQRRNTTVDAEPREGTLVDAPTTYSDLRRWGNRWDPSDRHFRSRVWDPEASAASSAFDTVQREFVAFVNPHKSVGRERLVQELNENVARRWIQTLGARADLGSAAVETVTELLFNLAAHPFSSLTSRPVTKRDVPMDRRFAMVALFTTSGGGGDRLHISVTDTGHGIPATLRPKLPRSSQHDYPTDAQLVRAMLSGNLPPYGRAEGRGFPRLVDLARRLGGTVSVITSGDDDIGKTIVAEVVGDGAATAEVLPTFDIEGTAVRVILHLERAPGTNGDAATNIGMALA